MPLAALLLWAGSAAALLWPGSAAAQAAPPTPRDRWALVQEAIVLQALDAEPRRTVERWERLVHRELRAPDASRSEALYWLAAARYTLGNVDGAREALDHCIRSGIGKARCIDLRAHIDLDAEAVRDVPVRWTFASPEHGVFHPHALWDLGSIRLDHVDERSVLVWSTQVDAVRRDQLVVGFDRPTPEPRRVRVRIRSLTVPAALAFELEDVRGRRYAPPERPPVIAPGAWTTLELRVADVRPLDPTHPPLAPVDLHRMVLRDVTALTGVLGPNELQIDELEVLP